MPRTKKASRAKRDRLPPVITVPQMERRMKRAGVSFPTQLGKALLHKIGEPVTYGGDMRALRQHLIEIRAAVNAALRLMKAMGG